ncbi:MAG: hypothetical protein J0L65_00490 [Xanthomonadales bacterium]|jgi:hypothetical protein|nr:hypothetical protein [Xanthomonadales bacterium]HRD71912.1 hypothetical protein [Aquimonas sp.]
MNSPSAFLCRLGLSKVAALLFGLSVAVAAPVVQPPINALWDRDTVLAEATFADQPEPNALRFIDVRVVHGGEARSEVTVRADDDAVRMAKPGTRYVLAWQETQGSPSTKKRRVMRPDGPQLLMSPGLSPALLEARPETRELLLQPPSAERLDGPAHLRRSMAGLRSDDPQMQSLFAAELFARSSLRQQLGAAEQRRLRAFVLSTDRAVAARSLVLEAALIFPTLYGNDWSPVAARLLAREQVSAAPAQANEGLLWTAFGILQRDGTRVPIRHLARWVACGNGALSELALHAIRRQAPTRELPLIEEALAEPSLAAGTREFLLEHRRRLLAMSERHD